MCECVCICAPVCVPSVLVGTFFGENTMFLFLSEKLKKEV